MVKKTTRRRTRTAPKVRAAAILPDDPSAQEVILILVGDMGTGASPLSIDRREGYAVLDNYRQQFEKQLANGRWRKDGPKVRNAAKQLGVIARAIASVRYLGPVPQRQVPAEALHLAAAIVEKECGLGLPDIEPGRWCKPDGQP